MATVRSLLNTFGRETLVRLMRDRQLGTARDNDERCERLARSFRGDVQALVDLLGEDELRPLLHTIVDDDGDLWICDGLAELSSRRLRTLARKVLVEDRIPAGYRCTEEQEEPGIDDDDEPEDEPEDESDDEPEDEPDDEPEDEAEDEPDDEAAASGDEEPDDSDRGGTPLDRVGDEFGRLLKLGRIFGYLGMETPRRLSQVRFEALVAELSRRGFEGEYDGRPLAGGTPTPGIHAKIRLRRRLPALPKATIKPGPAPVPLRGGGAAVRLTPLELATLRLQLLLAPPDFSRRGRRDEFLRAAAGTAELGALSPVERKQLEMVYVAHERGGHSASDVMARLAPALDERPVAALLEACRSLNAHLADIDGLIDAMRAELAGRRTPERARTPHPASLPVAAEPQDGANQRSLGALEDMFK